ncbi:MAG TPA: hypothetical protein VH396_06970 [Chitinophagaceae bacterium]|jgi:hypothetical protein
MKRILIVTALAISLTIVSCGNQNQSPDTNSPANTDSLANSNNSRDTSSGMTNDSLGNNTMKGDSSVK